MLEGKEISKIIKVKENEISIFKINEIDYISLTDLARYKNRSEPSDIIKKWLSNYDTIEYIGIWEELNNINFNSAEFRLIKTETLTPNKNLL
jgi:hypothetical protein